MQVCPVRQPVAQVLANGGRPARRGNYFTTGGVCLFGQCLGGGNEHHDTCIDRRTPEHLRNGGGQPGPDRESTTPIDGRPDPSDQPSPGVLLRASRNHADIRDCGAGIPSRGPAQPDHRDSRRRPGHANSSDQVAWHRLSPGLITRKDSKRSITWEARPKASGDVRGASPPQAVRPAANCR